SSDSDVRRLQMFSLYGGANSVTRGAPNVSVLPPSSTAVNEIWAEPPPCPPRLRQSTAHTSFWARTRSLPGPHWRKACPNCVPEKTLRWIVAPAPLKFSSVHWVTRRLLAPADTVAKTCQFGMGGLPQEALTP